MSRASPLVQVGFRCSREVADALNTLACRHTHGLRGVIATWLAAEPGYADVAQHDLARPDGRRRRMPAETAQGLATGD
jgi:hypothetical protein